MDAPVASLNVPGAQAIGAVLAVPQLLPIVQAVHSSAEPRSVALEKVPAGHGSGSAAPVGQNEPDTHSKHPTAPLDGWCVPASQLVHADCPGASV